MQYNAILLFVAQSVTILWYEKK